MLVEILTTASDAPEKWPITATQFWALSTVVETPGIRLREVAAILAIHRSTASNLIESLAAEKLLTKKSSENDARGVTLWVTSAGSRLHKKMSRTRVQLIADALKAVDQGSLSSLDAVLGQLVKAVRRIA